MGFCRGLPRPKCCLHTSTWAAVIPRTITLGDPGYRAPCGAM